MKDLGINCQCALNCDRVLTIRDANLAPFYTNRFALRITDPEKGEALTVILHKPSLLKFIEDVQTQLRDEDKGKNVSLGMHSVFEK
jgi:hypothetical protein